MHQYVEDFSIVIDSEPGSIHLITPQCFVSDHKSHLVQLVIMKNVSMQLLRVMKIFKTADRRIFSKHMKFEVKVEK